MLKLLSTVALIASTFVGFSQVENTNSIVLTGQDHTTWQEYYSDDNVTIEYKLENCDPEMGYDKEQVTLRAVNNTSSKLEVSWHALLYYNEKCKTCDYEDEYTFYVVLSPNETKTGSCSVYSEDYQLKIFSKFTDPNASTIDMKLTSFELDNIVAVEHLITE